MKKLKKIDIEQAQDWTYTDILLDNNDPQFSAYRMLRGNVNGNDVILSRDEEDCDIVVNGQLMTPANEQKLFADGTTTDDIEAIIAEVEKRTKMSIQVNVPTQTEYPEGSQYHLPDDRGYISTEDFAWNVGLMRTKLDKEG